MTSFSKVFYALLTLNVISYVAAFDDGDIIYGDVRLFGRNAAGRIRFDYSIEKCIEQGYCPDTVTTNEALWDQIATLSPAFLTETFSALNTKFKLRRFDKGIVVPDDLFVRKEKYITMIYIYSIMAIGIFLVNHFKQRLALEYEFKFSKLSKLMLNYLAFKTVLKFIYLALIFAYVGEERRMKFNMCLIYLTCEDYIQGPFAFALVALFAMGYGTRKFRIDASMAWKTLLLTACNVLLTLPILFREINKTWGILDSSLLGGPLAILHCGLIYICYKFGYNTYKVDRDQRYLDSAKAILFGVFLNTFFIVPDSLWNDGSFMIEHVAGSKDATSQGQAIPDLIEVVVIIYLINIWRDIREEELEYVELENVEILPDEATAFNIR